MKKHEQRRLQSAPRWFAAPAAEENAAEDDWWAKVLGRDAQPAT